MSSRKKGKKTKGQTLALTEFLAPGGVPTVPIKTTNWADDVDDAHESGYMSRNSKEPVVLPTAPRAARGPGVDEENIPTNPPYVAYISNLPYDVVEEDLTEFFQDLEVSNMRLPKDSTKLRGYGYVEFADRQSLIEALSLTSSMIKTRRVRIEVSNSSNDDRRGGRMNMGRDNRRDGYDDPERTSGDWRKPRDEPAGGGSDERFRGRGYEPRERREEREVDNKPGAWREGDRSVPSFGERRGYNDERSGGSAFGERRGYNEDRGQSTFGEKRGFREDNRRGFREEGGNRRGFRDEDRGDSRRGRDDDREKDRDWSREQGSGGGTWRSEQSFRPEVVTPPSEPRTRPKLNLQPRTKPIEPVAVADEPKEVTKEKESEPRPAPAAVPAANIFGAAKPVDTAAREREIEERLARESEKVKTTEEPQGENKATWAKRNGEARFEREKEKPRTAWRGDQGGENRGRQIERRQDSRGSQSGRNENRGDARADSRGPPSSRSGGSYRNEGKREPEPRRPAEKDRRSKDREDAPMPKAVDEEAPNFVFSNKYSMLPEDVDTDNMDD
ncbi:eukaryotic translation initiation factor 4B-like [Chelonus insularis]|uniref:eukaryotic translation initiation factor 4B-like n=1 Tax=Chelonus insularis TaxID=460826 RepID=UPI00158E75C8|nr:eukaryotic translation initiation factor 4B-like [Chelonus insularis]